MHGKGSGKDIWFWHVALLHATGKHTQMATGIRDIGCVVAMIIESRLPSHESCHVNGQVTGERIVLEPA
jgi:hypothetical protein